MGRGPPFVHIQESYDVNITRRATVHLLDILHEAAIKPLEARLQSAAVECGPEVEKAFQNIAPLGSRAIVQHEVGH